MSDIRFSSGAGQFLQASGVSLRQSFPAAQRELRGALEFSARTAAGSPLFPSEREPLVVPTTDSAREPLRILSEEVFRSALLRERKRADRFETGFALITIDVRSVDPAAILPTIEDATRETDILGWLHEGTVVGLIVAELPSTCDEEATSVRARVCAELSRRLPSGLMTELQFDCRPHARPGPQRPLESDPLFEDQSSQVGYSLSDRIKRVVDICGSVTLLLLLSPLLLVIAALVKLASSGPVLFKQVRAGQRAKPFVMLKFRTMHPAANSGLHQSFMAEFIRNDRAAGSGLCKIVNDPRTSRIGRFLRKTSLDELPQLWNVLKGEMSLVGPRPPIDYELQLYRSWHWRRVFEAKPGMTGLWQVRGRSRTTFDEMVRLDLRYARTRSLATDVKILLATPRAVASCEGAW